MERMLVEKAGETEKIGDVNWIMMIQQPTGDRSETIEHEERRCSGISASCKHEHESHTGSHDASECDTRQEPAETDYVLPNSNIEGSTYNQPDIRPESVNPVILPEHCKACC